MKIIDFRARPNTEQYMRLYEGTYAWDNFFNFPKPETTTLDKFIDSLEIENHKTKNLFKNLKKFQFNSALFIHSDDSKNLNFKRASSNIPKLAMLSDKGLNVKDLMTFEKIFIETKAIDEITKRLT